MRKTPMRMSSLTALKLVTKFELLGKFFSLLLVGAMSISIANLITCISVSMIYSKNLAPT